MEHEHLESLYPADSRFSEIEKMMPFIKEGSSCQLVAMPGVGRGNICKFLPYNRPIRTAHLHEDESKYHFVYINFAEIRNRPLIDVLKFIFLEFVSSLHERRLEKAFETTDAIFKDSLSYKDELVLFQGLKKAIDFVAYEQNLSIVLLFERFETYVPHVTSDFFMYMRSLREKAKYKFSVVFSTTRPLEDALEPTIIADFYEFFVGHTIYLELNDTSGMHFRIAYLEKLTAKKLEENLIESIFKATGGHGKLSRLATEILLAYEKEIVEKDVEEFLFEHKSIQGALAEIWYFLTPAEQEDVEKIAQNQTPGEHVVFLENIQLVRTGSFTIPLFARFVQERLRHPQSHEHAIELDSTTGAIHKGNLNLSEKLTSSEHRLLLFLMGNKDTILERDTIISAVWKENATTAGVTDQALDQLIFRLRKKIEENPNSPEHIQTVKGRGIKFTP